MRDKTILPNLLAASIAVIGWLMDGTVGTVLLSTGLFALSGAMTNWLAIHMLFERVPGLYGSGVIALRFEDLKQGIVDLVREELFGEDKIERLFESAAERQTAERKEDKIDAETVADGIDVSALADAIDVDAAFDQLLETVEESSFGSMLQMVGGVAALEPLRQPFGKRLKRFLTDAARSPRLQQAVARQLSSESNRERFRQRLEHLLQARLEELTPDMVRDLMSRLIRRHLGWLVVWGAVFGGLIGLVAGLSGALS
jgi:uncharacterized membrane protein YheB (UPF0754 family)